jgi:hypothetical protein
MHKERENTRATDECITEPKGLNAILITPKDDERLIVRKFKN